MISAKQLTFRFKQKHVILFVEENDWRGFHGLEVRRIRPQGCLATHGFHKTVVESSRKPVTVADDWQET